MLSIKFLTAKLSSAGSNCTQRQVHTNQLQLRHGAPVEERHPAPDRLGHHRRRRQLPSHRSNLRPPPVSVVLRQLAYWLRYPLMMSVLARTHNNYAHSNRLECSYFVMRHIPTDQSGRHMPSAGMKQNEPHATEPLVPRKRTQFKQRHSHSPTSMVTELFCHLNATECGGESTKQMPPRRGRVGTWTFIARTQHRDTRTRRATIPVLGGNLPDLKAPSSRPTPSWPVQTTNTRHDTAHPSHPKG